MNELLAGLNDKQKEAVLHFEGPLLILAGAGSGKTRVLTHRIAYLIEEHQVLPYHILALTFTNKAANEMRERVNNIIEYGAGSIWVSTFHSTCVRILRRFIDHLGYDNAFTIYDSDDQKSLMKDICKQLNIDTKKYKERTFLNAISSAKDELKTPEQYADEVAKEYNKKIFGRVYKEYQKRLKQNNALDFDDLIMLTVQLFQQNTEILNHYQERFPFILVDEYQDTNTAQFTLLSLLASRYQNLCVVGDDDQSIYRFRGANIHNILNFEKIFPATKVIRLEQNYRSTKNILAAASGVIKHNSMRKEKTLWTTAEAGAPISYGRYDNEYEEAQGIAADIHRQVKDGMSYSDFAILYRTNAQSRVFEEKLIYEGIPYRIIGAVNFYARKEIKDILCYLKTINNSADDIAIKRIINIPRRGIGQTTIGRISDYAFSQEMPFYEALRRVDEIPGCNRASAKIHSFVSLIEHFRMKLRGEMYSLEDMTQELLDVTGYVRELEAEDTDEANGRIENIESLMNKIVQYEEDNNGGTLNDLLEDIALVADIDTVSDDAEQVLLMTLHSAKGLEFPNVYICGMEETIFPGASAVFGDDPSELEEERRLCYVGITRAMKKLTLTSANQRMRNGEMNFNRPSRFINEIPRHLVKQTYGAVLKPETESKPTEFSRAKASLYTKDRKNPFANNPYIQKGMGSASPAGAPDYQVGDRVSHTKFGQGIVRSLTKLTNDYEVVIEFDGFGQRKLRSSFAKLTKL
ncbi:DNA helicase PcrA [Clostridium sp. AF37-5]|uniref:DNA helicase PcrA n=1 Tax=Clostridium sp. AF37-5 TaxID=2293016 RepID=UPI000E5259B6|nr:DNA helicase PcrA [Clostridium sp. AF37-5]RHO98914.1 DNA helicase PcrA [Clostridium sp. AF37-5]